MISVHFPFRYEKCNSKSVLICSDYDNRTVDIGFRNSSVDFILGSRLSGATVPLWALFCSFKKSVYCWWQTSISIAARSSSQTVHVENLLIFLVLIVCQHHYHNEVNYLGFVYWTWISLNLVSNASNTSFFPKYGIWYSLESGILSQLVFPNHSR